MKSREQEREEHFRATMQEVAKEISEKIDKQYGFSFLMYDHSDHDIVDVGMISTESEKFNKKMMLRIMRTMRKNSFMDRLTRRVIH